MEQARQFKAAGVIGWPVFQSRSPALHRYWLDALGIPGAYLPMPVQPGDVGGCTAWPSRPRFRGLQRDDPA